MKYSKETGLPLERQNTNWSLYGEDNLTKLWHKILIWLGLMCPDCGSREFLPTYKGKRCKHCDYRDNFRGDWV